MSETVGMKPIQNGQMYRQIFEAEVQLVNSLATSKATRRQKRLENEDVSRVQASNIHYKKSNFWNCKKIRQTELIFSF